MAIYGHIRLYGHIWTYTSILSPFASQQAASGGIYFQKWRIFDNQGCGWRNLVPYRPIYGHIGPYGTHRINIWPYIPQIWPDGMSGPVRMWCPARMWRPDAKSGPDICFFDHTSKDAQRNFTPNPFFKSPISLFWGRFVKKQFWDTFKDFYVLWTKHLPIVFMQI